MQDAIVFILTLVFFAALIGITYILMKKWELWGERSLAKIYEEMNNLPPLENDTDVNIIFYSYRGFLITFQTTHQHTLASQKANFLLKRLHQFNLMWCWGGIRGLYVPFISTWSYYQQKRRIRKQLESAEKDR